MHDFKGNAEGLITHTKLIPPSTRTPSHTAHTDDQECTDVSTCPSGYTHTQKQNICTYSHTDSFTCLTYHRITHTNTWVTQTVHHWQLIRDFPHKYFRHTHSDSLMTPLTFDLRWRRLLSWWCGFILSVWGHFLLEWLWGVKGAILVDKWGAHDMIWD